MSTEPAFLISSGKLPRRKRSAGLKILNQIYQVRVSFYAILLAHALVDRSRLIRSLIQTGARPLRALNKFKNSLIIHKPIKLSNDR